VYRPWCQSLQGGEGVNTGVKRSGPTPHPAWNLRVAAIEYAAAVEVSADDLPQTWDRLRKAAERYTHAEKRKGRPPLGPEGEG
jgi:hypothetical protein